MTWRRFVAVVAAAAVCSSYPYAAARAETPRPLLLRSPRAAEFTGTVEPGPHFDYLGGKVIEHLAVVQVLWGDGDYAPEVERTKAPSLASFYENALAGAYVDWLREYDTPTQSVGHGRFVGQFRITPSTAGVDLDDGQVAAELEAQIVAHHLPAPDGDTYYAVFFPAGITAHSFGFVTCDNVCGWHNAAASAVGSLVYAVHPDQRAPCQCATGDRFGDALYVASHEMIEAITDPLLDGLGWFDVFVGLGGEIADVCIDRGSFVGADGVTYPVAMAWSNRHDACIASDLPACGNGVVEDGEACDDGNLFDGDGCSTVCSPEEFIGCPDWRFLADVTVPATFFAVPGDPDRASGAQIAPNGVTLLSKDVGGDRWAIAVDPESGEVIGNVYAAPTGAATFVLCFPNPVGSLRCYRSGGCRGDSGRASGVQQTPDGDPIGTLVSKDVAAARWAIVQRNDLTVTGNVFTGPGSAPTFVYCAAVDGIETTLDCQVSASCIDAAACASLWQPVGVAEVPPRFFVAQ